MADVQFDRIASFDKGIAFAKPDLYYGAAPDTIKPRVRRDLGDQIVPSNNSHYPAVPNFFLEGKSDKGRADVAKKQACHDGAIGARAMHSLQNYGGDKAASSEAEEESSCPSHVRRKRRPSSTMPTAVTTYKAKVKQKLGRTFERDGQLVFAPDEEWKAATMSDRPALFNTKYNVWCFVD